ncbi:hypothetical protein ACO2RV_14510 [Ancylobacter sp. VNQ12]|uniref:hypothetical protein n=1 Tax=Ancylobacter sp. VNQ12 TaxID=3400920 RepID=UPI003C101056
MVQRSKRGLTSSEAERMQREVREFQRKVVQWSGEITIGTTVYVALEILNNDLIVMDRQLTSAIHEVTYQWPPGSNGLV